MKAISSWGNLSKAPHTVIPLANRDLLMSAITQPDTPALAFGMGKSYGDVCLNPEGVLWKTDSLDRFIDFDEQNGLVTCEAGVLLKDIQRLIVPRGWILPVTPGTQLITLGGAIANDVHGKNHHVEGSFGEHVQSLTLLRTTGEILECSKDTNNEWLRATIGGIGLTGLITSATLQLRPVSGPWLESETIYFQNLTEFFSLSAQSEENWEHTVAWFDCTSTPPGRGLFMRANPAPFSPWSQTKERKLSLCVQPPFSFINQASVRLFNSAYLALGKRKARQRRRQLTHYESFFYPLDHIQHWNRMYGPNGFYQYQCVVPIQDGEETIHEMLREIGHSGQGSFLAVLKTFGSRPSVGLMSFPRHGVTLALDFPNKGASTLALFERLDQIVLSAGGRLYLAKDARMNRDLFHAGYPQWENFLNYKDPGISSALYRRLMEVDA